MTKISPVDEPQPQFRRRPRPGTFLPAAIEAEPPQADDYEVGYGKPPKQHRFKPGQSGNPKGRPKGARGVNAIVREMLEKKTELTIRGKRRKVSFIKALLLKQLDLAAKGDQRAMAELIKFYRAAVPDFEMTVTTAAPAAIEDDVSILDAYRELILAEAAAEAKEDRS